MGRNKVISVTRTYTDLELQERIPTVVDLWYAPNDYNMIVTPKEIDDLIENMKDVIAQGINYAV